MSLKIALQMDPPERLNFATDSTILLGVEAQKRGHKVFYYTPDSLALRGQELTARARSLDLMPDQSPAYRAGAEEKTDLRRFDLILMRQDPPFDMGYITATHLLEHVMRDVLILNDPVSVRNAPEKLLVTHFADLMPPTLITRDSAAIRDFYAQHQDIILKPLYGNAGLNILHIGPESDNLNGAIAIYQNLNTEPFIAQKYIPEIRSGDKRLILIDGEYAGGINRIPQDGEARATLALGARAEMLKRSARDEEICARIGPELARLNLVFAGVDIIGDYLTEINITSPTGLIAANKLGGLSLERSLWDCFEAKISARR